MERPIVVTDPSERAPELIREAAEVAAAAGVPLRVLTIVSQQEFENDADVIGSIASVERTSYELERSEYAEQIAGTAVRDLMGDLDLETQTIGEGIDEEDERGSKILEVAEDEECDYIFLTGRRRSPTGKVIFGDTAQEVILNFDGFVVTAMN